MENDLEEPVIEYQIGFPPGSSHLPPKQMGFNINIFGNGSVQVRAAGTYATGTLDDYNLHEDEEIIVERDIDSERVEELDRGLKNCGFLNFKHRYYGSEADNNPNLIETGEIYKKVKLNPEGKEVCIQGSCPDNEEFLGILNEIFDIADVPEGVHVEKIYIKQLLKDEEEGNN